jgi:hypothetical protein
VEWMTQISIERIDRNRRESQFQMAAYPAILEKGRDYCRQPAYNHIDHIKKAIFNHQDELYAKPGRLWSVLLRKVLRLSAD